MKRRGFLTGIAALPAATWGSTALSRAVRESIALPTTTNIDGITLSPGRWHGKLLIVEKFASWCPFCKIVNPKLNQLLQTKRNRGLEVLALSIDRNPADVAKYMQQHRYEFHAAMWSPAWEQALGPAKGLPVIWVIGRDGRLKQVESGELLDEDVAELARWL